MSAGCKDTVSHQSSAKNRSFLSVVEYTSNMYLANICKQCYLVVSGKFESVPEAFVAPERIPNGFRHE